MTNSPGQCPTQTPIRTVGTLPVTSFDDGVPPNMVQRVMGHERSSTTLDLYTRRTDNSDRILRARDDEDDDPDDEGAGVLAST